MEVLPMKGLFTPEPNELRPSLPSSPSQALACVRAPLMFPSARKLEAEIEHMFCKKGFELQDTSTNILAASETECCEKTESLPEIPCLPNFPTEAGIAGLLPPVTDLESHSTSTPHRTNDPLRQEDIEANNHISENSTEANCVEQTLQVEQAVHAEKVACSQQEDAKLLGISTCIAHGLDDKEKHDNSLLQEASSHILSIANKILDDTEHAFADIELVSHVDKVDCEKPHSFLSVPPENPDNTKHPAHTEATIIQPSSEEVSLQEHLHQENIGRVKPSMPNFMMHRFLPAAQKIAAMEQESFIALIASRNQTTAASPSPSRPQRPSLSHRIKRRAHHASRGFTTTGLTHAKQQDGDMSRALKSCGIFCLGLKTTLFRAHHSATAARKTSRASHSSSNLTFSDKGSSFSGSRNKGDTDAMEGLRAARHTYSPSQASIKSHEIPLRDALKCHATLFSEGHSSVQWNPAFSQLGELDATANLDEERVGSAESGIVGLVSKKQECKQTAIECAATHNFTSSCGDDNLQISRVHDLVNANTNGSLLHIMGDVVEVISCPEQEQAWHVGGADVKSCKEHCQAWQEGSSDVDGESPFFDALSRLNSIKSTASFATCGSPATQGENLGLQDEGGAKNEEPCFMDAASDFETPTASMSEKQPMLNLAQVESKMSTTNGEPSSLSQRFGKVLKLDTREYTSVPKSLSSLNRKYPDFEDKSMLHLAGDWQVESFGCIDPGSLDRKYPLSPRTASPIFPAKCQSGSTVGWPLGISTYESSKLEGSPDHIGSEKRVKKYAPGSQLPSLPLPPAPKGSWLGKAMARNASSTSPLATVQQKYKVASARKKLDFLVAVQNSERQWEDVVKGSRVQTGHLRFSEELHQHHPLNHSAILPLKL